MPVTVVKKVSATETGKTKNLSQKVRNWRRKINELSQKLTANGYPTAFLSGNKDGVTFDIQGPSELTRRIQDVSMAGLCQEPGPVVSRAYIFPGVTEHNVHEHTKPSLRSLASQFVTWSQMSGKQYFCIMISLILS